MNRTIRRSLLVTVVSMMVILMASIVANADKTLMADPGTWNGTTYSYVIPEGVSEASVFVGIETRGYEATIYHETDLKSGTVSVDCSNALKEALNENEEAQVIISVFYVMDSTSYGITEGDMFYQLDVEVKNSEVVSEDTNVEFGLDSAYEVTEDEDEWVATKLDLVENQDYQFVNNKLVINKGESGVKGTLLYFRRLFSDNRYDLKGSFEFDFIKVKAGKVKSDDVYTFADSRDIEHLKEILTEEKLYKATAEGLDVKMMSMKNFGYSPETFVNELAKALTEKGATGEAFIAKCEISDTMVFASKGVNTADSNDIAMWIALFAIATVAAGAVALKKN